MNYIFYRKTFTDENLDEYEDTKFRVKIIRDNKEIDKLLPNIAIKQFLIDRINKLKHFIKIEL